MNDTSNNIIVNTQLRLTINYSISILNIDNDIPIEKNNECMSYIYYMAGKLGDGTHIISWQYLYDYDIKNANIKVLIIRESTGINQSSKNKSESIINDIAEKEGISPLLIKVATKKREIVQTRQIAMYFLFKYTDITLTAIGELFNGKDHATVLHAVKTINNLIDTDKDFRNKIEDIELNIISKYYTLKK